METGDNLNGNGLWDYGPDGKRATKCGWTSDDNIIAVHIK